MPATIRIAESPRLPDDISSSRHGILLGPFPSCFPKLWIRLPRPCCVRLASRLVPSVIATSILDSRFPECLPFHLFQYPKLFHNHHSLFVVEYRYLSSTLDPIPALYSRSPQPFRLLCPLWPIPFPLLRPFRTFLNLKMGSLPIQTSFDVEDVLSQLNIAEKVALLSGVDFWHTAPVHRLGVPSIRVSDGPNGVRGTRFFNGVPAACLPCGLLAYSSTETQD